MGLRIVVVPVGVSVSLLMCYSEHRLLVFSCCSFTKSCPTPCNLTDCSAPGFTVLQPSSGVCPSSRRSNHLALSCPLCLLPSFFPSIKVFSNELALHFRWPKYWSFGISPSNKYSVLISFRIDWFDSLLSKGLSRVFSSTTVRKHQFFCAQPSF